jgi:type I restriction enzyme R subunit
MPAPGEHKTVQARILKYAQEIGWPYVPRDETDRWHGLTKGGFSNPPLKEGHGGQECPPSVENVRRFFLLMGAFDWENDLKLNVMEAL